MTESNSLRDRGLVKSALAHSVDDLAEIVERRSLAERRKIQYGADNAAQTGRLATLVDHQLWLTSLLTDGAARYKPLPSVLLGANAPSQSKSLLC
jgi:hypothetical protein